MRADPRARLVLLVDDSEDDRMFARDALRHVAPDVLVAEATNGVEAMAYLRDETRPLPDLVLLDLKMPLKDGFEVLAEMRLDPRLRHVPVVTIFTTATDQSFVRTAYAAGANAFVGKPSTMAGLHEVMTGIVRHWFEIATLPQSR
ncbi:response regulator [soil metagenome]